MNHRDHIVETKLRELESDLALLRARHEHESAIRDLAETELRGEVATLKDELAAYRKAKQENDERFMIERDEARSELATLKADLHRTEELLGHHARELAARDLTVADLRAQVDGRIEWQAHAVAHLQAWSRLFDAAVAMKENHEGCVSEPEPCGDCFRCRFDKAVDDAMTAVAAGSPETVMRAAALHMLRNCAICPDCGLGVKFDDEACCATCGRDVFGFIDGRSAGLLAYVEDYERVCEESNRMRTELAARDVECATLRKTLDDASYEDGDHLPKECRRMIETLWGEICVHREECPKVRKAMHANLAAWREAVRQVDELASMRPVFDAAKDVLSERAAKIKHARETAAMCRMQRAVDAALSASQKEQAGGE